MEIATRRIYPMQKVDNYTVGQFLLYGLAIAVLFIGSRVVYQYVVESSNGNERGAGANEAGNPNAPTPKIVSRIPDSA